jgi:amino acid adenylation domain-containing protein
VEKTVGMLINTIPARARICPAQVVSEWLQQLQTELVADRDYQYAPLTSMQAWSSVERGQRLFHSIVAIENQPVSDVMREFAPGLRIASGRVFEQSNYPLNLKVVPDGTIRLELLFDDTRFDRDTAKDILKRLCLILEGVAGGSDRTIAQLSTLSAEERRAILLDCNETTTPYLEQCIHRTFEQQAARRPDAPCLSFSGQVLTYSDVNRQANRLANKLRQVGVEGEELVGLCVEPSPAMVVGMLGILKAGAAFLPLDPDYPLERLAYMVTDANLAWVVADAASEGRLPRTACARIVIEDAISTGDDANLSIDSNIDHLAYAIYTSGSTGKPKGALLPHRGLANLVDAQMEMFGVDEDSRVLQFSSLSFDASVFQIVMALRVGARLCIAPKAARYPGAELLELLERERVSIVTIPPSVLAALPSKELPALGVITVAGEACPAELVKKWAIGRRFFNLYGPTETTIWATAKECTDGASAPTIGKPIPNFRAYALDRQMQPVPFGAPGELHIAGVGLARGYLNRPELTAERFVTHVFEGRPAERLYKTGDLVRLRPDGEIEFVGRVDDQVKVRGFRIELGEIQAQLEKLADVDACTVVARDLDDGTKQVLAYVVPARGSGKDEAALKSRLREFLPSYMIPERIVFLGEMPLTLSGKIDRKRLPAPGEPAALPGAAPALLSNTTEDLIAQAWRKVLGLERVGADDNFFDLGGHSLHMIRLQGELRLALSKPDLSIVELFQFPTVRSLGRHVQADAAAEPAQDPAVKLTGSEELTTHRIAVIGMSGRFPGAKDLGELWRNLREGAESVSTYTADELLQAGVPRSEIDNPNYVRAGVELEDMDKFDAPFFGMNAREAKVTDPQHRLFLECAHEALQAAGYEGPGDSRVGVFAASSLSEYLLFHLIPNREQVESVGMYQILLGNDKDHLATRVSYKLGLTGPSVNVQTACSSSLVAVHLACRAVQEGSCEMAIAGGVNVSPAGKRGYLRQDQGILSKDGHCRPFDAGASGTYAGAGCGIVLLKRLDAAQRDGDTIHAVILGSAVNNDGTSKAGYTAPSVQGQAEVITAAQQAAGVAPNSISYVEAHGTATAIGDPIEVKALTTAFARDKRGRGSCAIGSIKSNMGHLDAAAGVAGLIKTILQLENRELVPSLHFEHPNPAIDFDSGPFRVQTRLQAWDGGGAPLRAGVSSFGIGGANVHVVLEEPPAPREKEPARAPQLLTVSAQTGSALAASARRLAAHLRNHSELDLADVAFTLHAGRRRRPYRGWVVADSRQAAVGELEALEHGPVRRNDATGQPVAFLFPGQGSQYPGMGKGLYENEPYYRDAVDQCCRILEPHLGLELRDILFGSGPEARERITRTEFAQPALFVTEYAVARLWMQWGVPPAAMLGHSIGEWVAATVAGIFSVDDALNLVAARGRLMQAAPAGAMVAVNLSESELRGKLPSDVAIAAVNAPSSCVVSGSFESMDALERDLAQRGVATRRLVTSHAFHSASMNGAKDALAEAVRKVPRNAPRIPVLSNVTGQLLTDDQARDPEYWARQLREPVRFGECLAALAAGNSYVLLEAGPGQALAALAQMQFGHELRVVPSMRQATKAGDDQQILLRAAGQLWEEGVLLDWDRFHGGKRRRVVLPAYPYERARYFVERKPAALPHAGHVREPSSAGPCCRLPSWRRSLPPGSFQSSRLVSPETRWLLVADHHGFAPAIRQQLLDAGVQVVVAEKGDAFRQTGVDSYEFDGHSPTPFRVLLEELKSARKLPNRVLDLSNFAGEPSDGVSAAERARVAEDAFLDLMRLGADLAASAGPEGVELTVVASGVHRVTGHERLIPEKAAVIGPCRVLPQEHPSLRCRLIDVEPASSHEAMQRLAGYILAEVSAEWISDGDVAYRGRDRWTGAMDLVELAPADAASSKLRSQGVYVITGGLGGIGLEIAHYLAEHANARVTLLSRSGLPERSAWKEWLERHDSEDGTSVRIRKIQEIERAGGSVLTLSADMSRVEDVGHAIRLVKQTYGVVHGIIHAAGIGRAENAEPGSREEARQIFAPKLLGAIALEEALRDEPLDFIVHCSSISSIVGGAGLAAYSSANACLDALAQAAASWGDREVISIDWGTWQQVGMAARLARESGAKRQEAALERALTPHAGRELFGRALAAGAPQIAISGDDLIDALRQAAPQPLDKSSHDSEKPACHPRPALSAPYVAPATEVHEQLCQIWQQLLGVEPIGIQDDFFDLGGHSLLGTQLVAQVQEAFGVRIPLRSLFETPTVRELAFAIETEMEELAMDSEDVLAAVEALSEAEVESELRRRAGVQN